MKYKVSWFILLVNISACIVTEFFFLFAFLWIWVNAGIIVFPALIVSILFALGAVYSVWSFVRIESDRWVHRWGFW